MEKSKVWIIIIVAIAVYLIMAIIADFNKLISALLEFKWIIIPVIFALTTANYLLRYIKWDFFLKKAGVNLETKQNLFVFFSGLAMIITPGKIGEIWKGWLIRDINGEKLSKTVPVVLVERLTDVLGLVILAMFGVLYYGIGIFFYILLLIGVVAFFIMIRSEKLSEIIIKVLERRTGKYADNIKTIHKTFKVTMEPKGLISMSLLSAFAWFFECIGLYLVIIGFGEAISITLSTFIFSFASLAGAVSMIPGGLGVAEATISGMLQLFGLNSTVSIGISIIIRFGTLWYGAIMGLLVYLICKSKIIPHKKLKT